MYDEAIYRNFYFSKNNSIKISKQIKLIVIKLIMNLSRYAKVGGPN